MMHYGKRRRRWLSALVIPTILMTGCALPEKAKMAQVDAQETQKVAERSDIDQQHLWATENIFPNKEAWEKEFAALKPMIEKLAGFKGTLSQGPEQLAAAVKLRDELEPRLARVYVYASLLADQDTRVSEHQGMRSRVRSLFVQYGAATSWAEPEMIALGHDKLKKWMAGSETLAVYGHAFDDLFRQQEHILSAREEQLLALTGDVRAVPVTAYGQLANADLKYPTIKDENGNDAELSDSAFYLFMRCPDRKVRQAAYEGIVGTYKGMRNTTAALLSGVVQSHILTVKSRGYDNCLQAALDGGNIPPSVYQTLIDTVNDNLHLLHRYQQIRKDALKLTDGVHAYDLFAPFVGDTKLEYEYQEAVDTILTALEPMGAEYLRPMRKGFNSRWVDVYPTKGKRSGAYSSGTFLTQPYILLNYHGGYDDVSTLAHEMGHSMHSYFSRGTQPYVYADYDIFCAEVASVTNELLLQEYVLTQIKDPKQKLYLLVELLEGFRGTVFRQTMFSEFEQRVHEMAEAGEPLTADSLDAAYGEIMKKYYGPAYAHDDLVNSYWQRIPHFYYNFYVYKYATSYCASANIADRILAGEPGAVEAYMSFLKAGSHLYPIDVLKLARVDMTSPAPVQAAMQRFKKLLDETEALLKEMGRL